MRQPVRVRFPRQLLARRPCRCFLKVLSYFSLRHQCQQQRVLELCHSHKLCWSTQLHCNLSLLYLLARWMCVLRCSSSSSSDDGGSSRTLVVVVVIVVVAVVVVVVVVAAAAAAAAAAVDNISWRLLFVVQLSWREIMSKHKQLCQLHSFDVFFITVLCCLMLRHKHTHMNSSNKWTTACWFRFFLRGFMHFS